MAKFRYYITDLFDGVIKGTDNKDTALSYAQCVDFFVVDTETGLWLCEANETVEIKEVK